MARRSEAGRPLGGAWVECTGLPEAPRLRDGLAGTIEAEIDRELARVKPADLALDDMVEAATNRAVARLMPSGPRCGVRCRRTTARLATGRRDHTF